MHRALRVSGIIVFAVALLFALLVMQSRSVSRSASINLRATAQAALANPVEFAKSRITGGVGVNLSTDLASGFPIIRAVGAGSPADRAGLHVGDLITKVDGWTTTNRTLAQLTEAIRGFTAGTVTLSIQRGGATNFECVIRRSSWKTLRGLSYRTYE